METNQRTIFRKTVAELLGLDLNKVILAMQNAPKQTKTFATLHYYSNRQEVPYEHIATDTPGEIMTVSRNTLVCEVQLFATTSTDACEALQTMVDGFDRPPIIDRLQDVGLAIVSCSVVNDISALLDETTWETRASVDITMRYTRTVIDNVGSIEKIRITGTMPGSNAPDLDIESEV